MQESSGCSSIHDFDFIILSIFRAPPVPRFKIKDYIPETNIRHLDIVIQEVEELMVTKQVTHSV